MHIIEVIRRRRTIELFRPDKPPPSAVLEAIDAARWAPNHKHTEPWQFHLLGPETAAAIVELAGRLTEAAKGAEAAAVKRKRWSAVPGWLAVTCARSADPIRQEEDYAACCCAVQNLALVLWDAGIGVKWSTGEVTRHAEFFRLLGVDPAERKIVGLLWYGYPASVPEQRRRPVSEILREYP
jgi:nitroreductase